MNDRDNIRDKVSDNIPDLTIYLVGIGTGNPDHITDQGKKTLCQVSVILIPKKGPGKEDLHILRHNILRDIASPAQIVEFDMPERDESLPYKERVSLWHDQIATRWQRAIHNAFTPLPNTLTPNRASVALLVWGDPGLYDSTLRIAKRLTPRPKLRVIPGISALQALSAAHTIALNTLNGSITITTGRRLRDEGWPKESDTLIVMLDGQCSFQQLPAEGVHIWWGAFLGMKEEILASGPLEKMTPEILLLRAKARKQHGWIMDSYILRRTSSMED